MINKSLKIVIKKSSLITAHHNKYNNNEKV